MSTTLGEGDPFVLMDHQQHQQRPYNPNNNNNDNNNNNNNNDYYTGNNSMLTKLSHMLEKKHLTQDINLIGK